MRDFSNFRAKYCPNVGMSKNLFRYAEAYIPESYVCTDDFRTNANHSRVYNIRLDIWPVR